MAQIGDDEANTGIQFAGIPFDLGNTAAFPVSRSRMVAGVGVVAANMADACRHSKSAIKIMILKTHSRIAVAILQHHLGNRGQEAMTFFPPKAVRNKRSLSPRVSPQVDLRIKKA